MKIFKVIILLGIFSCNTAYCQQNSNAVDSIDAKDVKRPGAIKGNNVFINDSSLDRYVGTWVWKSSTKSLTVTLSKKLMHYGSKGHILDVMILVGNYRYFDNGKLMSPSDNFLSGSSGGKRDTINLFISDNLRKTSIALSVSYLNSNSLQIELDSKRFEFKNDKAFQFPSPVILTKEL